MATDAQKRAMNRYYEKSKEHMRTYIFKVDIRKEPKLAQWLDSKNPKAEYIRNTLKKAMERGE